MLNNFLNKKLELNVSHLILGAIILLLLWLLFKPVNVDLSKYDKQKQEIDSLNNMLINLQQKQFELDKSVLSHQSTIDSLVNEISYTNQKIIDIRAYYDAKIKDINNYTPSQLNEFFSNRYK
jgi:peptidoglycan hydrolase CwlO-like protein